MPEAGGCADRARQSVRLVTVIVTDRVAVSDAKSVASTVTSWTLSPPGSDGRPWSGGVLKAGAPASLMARSLMWW